MPIEDTKDADAVGQVGAGNVGVLLGLAPALHARGSPLTHVAVAVLRVFLSVRISEVRSHLVVLSLLCFYY